VANGAWPHCAVVCAGRAVTGLHQITEGLMAAGFRTEDIRAIMGGHVQRPLLQNLP